MMKAKAQFKCLKVLAVGFLTVAFLSAPVVSFAEAQNDTKAEKKAEKAEKKEKKSKAKYKSQIQFHKNTM